MGSIIARVRFVTDLKSVSNLTLYGSVALGSNRIGWWADPPRRLLATPFGQCDSKNRQPEIAEAPYGLAGGWTLRDGRKQPLLPALIRESWLEIGVVLTRRSDWLVSSLSETVAARPVTDRPTRCPKHTTPFGLPHAMCATAHMFT